MKALLHDGEHGYRLIEMPRPEVGPGTIVVRVRVVGICRSHVAVHRHKTGKPERVPNGYEVSGEIVEVGQGVSGWAAGDRVAVDVTCQGLACGKCRYCLAGQFRRCLNRIEGWGGGFAEYMKRRAWGCYRLPDGVSWKAGALTEPLAVSVHALRRGDMRGGETVVVLGAGTIGLTAIAAAKLWGARRVFATARYPHQAALAGRLGADAAFTAGDRVLERAVLDATGGIGADLVVETVGGTSPDTMRQAATLARPLGRIVVVGGFQKLVEVDLLTPLLKEHNVLFSYCYGIQEGRADFQMAVDILASSGLPLEDIVTHTFPIERFEKAFDMAADKSQGSVKVQLAP
jgi:threonine dehydrogenase-like Zn-dependent dehydrogenase